MREMSEIDGMYVEHNGQDNGAEDETKIHIHDQWNAEMQRETERDEMGIFSDSG